MSKLEVKEIGAISGETEVTIRDPLKVSSIGALDQSTESITFPTGDDVVFNNNYTTFGQFDGDGFLNNSISQNSGVNWNFGQLNLKRRSNSVKPRYISMMLDGDNANSTKVGDYNGIWGSYTSAPTAGSTSAALSGEMHYGAYAGHKFYVNGTQSAGVDPNGTLFQVADGKTMDVVNAQDMVDLLKGLKDAVNSQTTVEGMRSSIESISDTLISKYEDKVKEFVEPEHPEGHGENL